MADLITSIVRLTLARRSCYRAITVARPGLHLSGLRVFHQVADITPQKGASRNAVRKPYVRSLILRHRTESARRPGRPDKRRPLRCSVVRRVEDP